MVLPFYRCPSYAAKGFSEDPLYTAGQVNFSQFAIRNYVCLGAKTVVGLSGAAPAEGVMYPGSKSKFRDMIDGTSNTVVIAETREENASVWIDGTSASVAARWMDVTAAASIPPYGGASVSINYSVYFQGGIFPNSIEQAWGPSSFHVGGAHHLLGDGSVRFLSENLNVLTYDALVTRAGNEVTGEF
jgi:hypothetical protein